MCHKRTPRLEELDLSRKEVFWQHGVKSEHVFVKRDRKGRGLQ